MTLEREWTFDVRRCADASGDLLPPERIPLDALLDPQRLVQAQMCLSALTQMEASVYLYDETFPMPIRPDREPMLVHSPLCRELNALQEATTGLSRCLGDTWRASLRAMRERQPIVADCVGGRRTLWSCPILLVSEGRAYPKAAITVAAFPIENFFAEDVLEALFPGGRPSLRESHRRAREMALARERLDQVREVVRFMAEAFSMEISLRYELVREQMGVAHRATALVEALSRMAHEINNRLTSIHLHAQLARQSVGASEAEEPLELIKREARSAIEDVRALTRYVRRELTLAEDREEQMAAAREEGAEPLAGSKSILVVDDERPVAELIARALRAAQYHVDVALNGEAALSLIERKHYDLIIADLRMPGTGGIELYEHFQRVAPSVARRMVFLTGDVLSAQVLDFLRETGSLHLPKPCTLEELLTLVRVALERGESSTS
ncbi:Response regulator receiver protein [bacterium HR10]|nr:Response regulator receiver protein [bacterium HR10]